MWYVLIIVGFLALCFIIAWCLCVAAARGDERMTETRRRWDEDMRVQKFFIDMEEWKKNHAAKR